MSDKKFDINFADGNFASAESFKSWNVMWEPDGTVHEWIDESHTCDGSGCLRIYHPDTKNTASHISRKITLVKDARYKFSGYIKFDNIISRTANGNGGAYCVLGDAYIGKYTEQDVPFSADWTYFESFYTATYTGEYVFSCKIWGAVGCAYFDDLSVELIEEIDPEVLKHWPAEGAVKAPGKGFTLVAIGDPQGVVCEDVQHGTDRYVESLKNLLSMRDEWNIQYIMDMGDLTDVSSDLGQWELSAKGHQLLKDAGMKYSLDLGNHDYEGYVGLRSGVITTRKTDNFRNTFPLAPHEAWIGSENFGSYDGTMLDTYQKFTYGGRKYMIIALEFSPTAEIVKWAKDLCDSNPDTNIIFTTHCLFRPRGTLNIHSEQSNHIADGATSQYMWDNLISKCPNIFLTCCGHCDCHGTAAVYMYGDSGNLITNIIVNPQGTLGGSEMMTAFINIDGENKITCYAYSPTVCKFYAGSNYRFSSLCEKYVSGNKVILPEGFCGKLFGWEILDGASDKFEYTSSDESVASVSEDGTLKALSKGETVFRCIVNTAQSAYAAKGPGARARVEFVVNVK